MPQQDYSQVNVGGYASYNPYNEDYKRKEEKGTNKSHEVSIKEVVRRVTDELKQILKGDINKKILVNTVFKMYEDWWETERLKVENRSKYTEKKDNTNSSSKSNTNSTVPDINQLINSNRDNLDFSSCSSLGLRASIPKMPSFRRVRRKISPIPKDEDSQKHLSDQEEMVQGSDDEKEQIPPVASEPSITYNRPKSRLLSTSSVSSTSSEDEEDDEAEDESSDSTDLSDEETPKLSHKSKIVEMVTTEIKKDKAKVQDIYSDSDDEGKVDVENVEDSVKEDDEVVRRVPDDLGMDLDEISKDSIIDTPATPGAGGASTDEEEKEEEVVKKPPEKKSTFDFDRLYSDSEEEREYQEKRRRNTEYMEQIEREFQEEQERNRKEGGSAEIPPTPGVDLLSAANIFAPIPPSSPPKKEPKVVQEVVKKEKKEKPEKKKDPPPKKERKKPEKKVKDQTQAADVVKKPEVPSDSGFSLTSYIAFEHDYCLPPESYVDETNPCLLAHDHGYSSAKEKAQEDEKLLTQGSAKSGPGRPKKESVKVKAEPKEKKPKERKRKAKDLVLDSPKENIDYKRPKFVQPPIEQNFIPREVFQPRANNEESAILFEILSKGIDQEDIDYLRRSYEKHLQDDVYGNWLNCTHWVEHCPTNRTYIPPPVLKKKGRRNQQEYEFENSKHKTGSARTEGFYKMDSKDKAKYKYHHAKSHPPVSDGGSKAGQEDVAKTVAKFQGASREARSNQRRLLTAFGSIGESELLKFNQLKFRKKQLKFAKSAIHDWGLFALEPIAADEMVIEYVGQMIRPVVADLREHKYEAIGIGSSYLFRIDMETIIDATKCGNLARFINHSCMVSSFVF